jgi:hypothetical protein
MTEEKIPELEVEQSEVEPLDLPEGRRRTETGDQQDFGKDPSTGKTPGEEPDDGSHPMSGKDSGKFPRATKRRSHREEQAERKKQTQQHHKMMQEMRKPIRHGDLMQIYQQIRQFMVAPVEKKLQDAVDKLALIPDFLSEVLGKEEIDNLAFEDYYEKWLEEKKKEAEELAKKEQEAKEAAAKAAAEMKDKGEDEDCLCEQEEGCFRCSPDSEDTPETEETQTE